MSVMLFVCLPKMQNEKQENDTSNDSFMTFSICSVISTMPPTT